MNGLQWKDFFCLSSYWNVFQTAHALSTNPYLTTALGESLFSTLITIQKHKELTSRCELIPDYVLIKKWCHQHIVRSRHLQDGAPHHVADPLFLLYLRKVILWFSWSNNNAINGTNEFLKWTFLDPRDKVKRPSKAKHVERTQRNAESNKFCRKQ